MKTIDFFLASSVTDLHEQRMELGSYFQDLNNRFHDYGLYIRLNMCEYVDNNMVLTRKQDEFNDLIRRSDYFLVLIWHKAGDYTLEEFDVALKQFRETGSPIIRTYFCTMEKPDPDNPGKIMPIQQSVTDFKTRLDKELGHIYTEYSSLDRIKLDILNQVTSLPESHAAAEARDRQETRDEPEPSETRSPADETIADAYFDLAYQHDQNVYLRENSEKLYRDALEIYRRLAWVQPAIYDPKVAMTCNNLALLYADTADRRDDAEKLYGEALEIYRRLARTQPAVYEPYVAGTCNNLANLISDYAKRRDEAEKLYGEALAIRRRLARTQPAVYEPDVAMTCNNLAALYANDADRRDDAEKLYNEALAIRRRLALAQPAVYEPDVAMTCNNLANLYNYADRRDEAEKLYGEALAIYRRLALAQPAVYEPDMALTLFNMGNLYQKSGDNRRKKQCHREAKALAEKYPNDYYCAQILNRLK